MRKYLLIALIYLMGCESPSECIEHYFSDNYRSYFYFNEGSYWIYEDTILGITDSVYLVSQTIEFDEDCRPSTQPHEVLYHIFTSSYFKGNDNYQWYAGGNARTGRLLRTNFKWYVHGPFNACIRLNVCKWCLV